MTSRTRKPPSFTLPLFSYPGLSPDTQGALEDLFSGPRDDGLQALMVIPKNTVNRSDPSETGFLIRTAEGVNTASAFCAPSPVRRAGAAAAYMISHDPRLQGLFAAMSLAARAARHDRFAITEAGCLSWRALTCLATRGKEAAYQDALDAGSAICGYLADRTSISAHQRLEIQSRLGRIAEQVYALELSNLAQRRRTGLYRHVCFSVSDTIGSR